MKASTKNTGKLLAVMLFITFGMVNAKAQTKTKTETIELKTANPDIVIKVIRDGKILETKALNKSGSKSFELDYSVSITLKSKTKTFTKTLKNGATAMLPLKPNNSTFNKSVLLSSADDKVKYINGTQIKAPQDQSLYNSLISAELVNFTAKEIKPKTEELTSKQKPATPQKKPTGTTTTKAKSEEAILVAPKPKAVEVKNTSIKRTAQDQEIFELSKKNEVWIYGMRDYNGDGQLFFVTTNKNVEKVPGNEPLGRIYYQENGKDILLKDLKLKDMTAIGFNYSGKLDENGNFCLNFRWNSPGNMPDSSQNDGLDWSDIVTLEGENLLNDKTIDKVTYKGNGIYELQKRGQKTPTEQYNLKTKKITSIQ